LKKLANLIILLGVLSPSIVLACEDREPLYPETVEIKTPTAL